MNSLIYWLSIFLLQLPFEQKEKLIGIMKEWKIMFVLKCDGLLVQFQTSVRKSYLPYRATISFVVLLHGSSLSSPVLTSEIESRLSWQSPSLCEHSEVPPLPGLISEQTSDYFSSGVFRYSVWATWLRCLAQYLSFHLLTLFVDFSSFVWVVDSRLCSAIVLPPALLSKYVSYSTPYWATGTWL